jgi:hypothetical protein
VMQKPTLVGPSNEPTSVRSLELILLLPPYDIPFPFAD